MTRYVIGVDTGFTKSHLALFDSTGVLIDFGHWGPLNHEALPGSFMQFENELGQFVSGIIQKNKITMEQISNAVLGIAGADTRRQHRIISDILYRIGFKRFTLVNDAFLGIPAGSRTGIGICAINGSGCTLAGLNKEGKTLQIGGVGYISNDMGGGGNLGQFVVSAVFSELFRKAEPTLMTPAFLEYLEITDKHDFVERIYEKIEGKSFDLLACIRILFRAAAKDDKVALAFLREIAANYAGGISTMTEELQFSKDEVLDIVLAGSVFVKAENPILTDSLKEMVSKQHPGYRINYVVLELPPVAGAVIWALNTLNGKNVYFDKVSIELGKIAF